MQVLAMYLPQFHNVEENNLWWGEGFTEWTAVKGAKKLFDGHEQPRVPQEKKYYDLLNKETMEWQTNLMKKYSVDGMCMYHYWFKDGRQILEKPVEKLLEWTEIDMPFCFSWANETWARSWSSIREKNVWANTFEFKDFETDAGILLEQKYGAQEDWEKHFIYLLPFFRDSRYIKIDGKPLFLIHQTSLIPCIKDMIDFWRKLSIEAGFSGIYFIGSNCNTSAEKVVDGVLYAEPGRSSRLLKKQVNNQIQYIDYQTLWNEILNVKRPSKKTYLGAFVGYDDTPRRGMEGTIITSTTPQKFCTNLTEIMAKNAAWDNDFLFLNAWNEWGEGMYLEPDEKYGFQFLEAIPFAKSRFEDKVMKYRDNTENFKPSDSNEILNLQEKKDKFEHYLNLLDDWMNLRERGISLTKILISENLYNIGVYGLGILGRHFLKEVLNSNINVSFIVDQQGDKVHTDIPVYLPNEALPEVDSIIVSATFYYYEIVEQLKVKGIKNVMSLEMLIKESE